MAKNEEAVKNDMFGFGKPNEAYAKYFSGQSFLNALANNKDANVNVSNVSFEPGCYNDWHRHNGFQILICTAGEGWVQERGKKAQLMKPGDIFIAGPGTEHWHGATKDSWFSHIAITSGSTDWLEKVQDYNELNN